MVNVLSCHVHPRSTGSPSEPVEVVAGAPLIGGNGNGRAVAMAVVGRPYRRFGRRRIRPCPGRRRMGCTPDSDRRKLNLRVMQQPSPESHRSKTPANRIILLHHSMGPSKTQDASRFHRRLTEDGRPPLRTSGLRLHPRVQPISAGPEGWPRDSRGRPVGLVTAVVAAGIGRNGIPVAGMRQVGRRADQSAGEPTAALRQKQKVMLPAMKAAVQTNGALTEAVLPCSGV